MRHLRVMVAAALSVLVIGACASDAFGTARGPLNAGAAAAASGGWGRAEQVPGLAALAGSGDSGLIAVSCASPGNCSADSIYGTLLLQQRHQGSVVVVGSARRGRGEARGGAEKRGAARRSAGGRGEAREGA